MGGGIENTETPKERKSRLFRAWRLKNKERRNLYNCQWDRNNRDKVNARKRVWVRANREKIASQNAAWNKKNPQVGRAAARRYRANNRILIASKFREAMKDPRIRIIRNLRKRLHEFIHQKLGGSKNLFGITPNGLREHIARQFREGMGWGNYGEWHIDHIRPISSFDLTDSEQVRAASNWQNLQPLWAAENMSKGDRWLP